MSVAKQVREAAELMVKLHGEEAPMEASVKTLELLRAGEVERALIWLRIMVTSKSLLAREIATT
ncbi:MAG TPA: hypothetical protein VKY65_19910 [Alphaproteobacteria bacterium]|nr:hypothetical protein [Alphaproteobacteria bacterium]